MKIFTKKNFIQKLVIALVCVIMLNFCAVPKVQAGFGGMMMDYVTDFLTAIADVAASLVQFGVTGEWKWAVDDSGTGEPASEDYFAKKDNFKYPILQISPELIFANEIQLLDANFIQDVQENDKYILGLEDDQPLRTLRGIISGWYVTLRTIAIVGLLSVLIYIGIRIIISSTADDKAKYKQRLMDWVVAFCLLFFMHYIMAAVLSVVGQVNKVLSTNVGIYDGIELQPQYYVKYTKKQGIKDPNGADGDSIREYEVKKVIGDVIENSFPVYKTYNTMESYLKDGTIKRTPQYGENTYSSSVIYEADGEKLTINFETYTMDDGSKCIIKGTVATTNEDVFATIDIENYFALIAEKSEQFDTSPSDTSVDSDVSDTYVGKEQSKGIENTKVIRSANGANIRIAGAALDNGSRVLYFTNYARLFLNNNTADKNIPISIAYMIIYIALIVFTVVFAIRYIKRVIYIAFLTLMAPMVALTYPLDKIKDRKSTSLEYVV